MSRPTINFDIDGARLVKNLFWILMIIASLFVLIDATINYGRLIDIGSIRRLCNIAKEGSLAAWFASFQMLMTGMILFLVYAVVKKMGGTKWRVRGWLIMACFFTYLAVDDGAAIHERVGTAFDTLFLPAENGGKVTRLSWVWDYFPSYTWQLIFGPVFGGMGIFIFIFLWREFTTKQARCLYILALATYAMAVGYDFVEGIDGAFAKIAGATGLAEEFVSHFMRVIEEYLELVGTAFFLTTFLRHLMSLTREMRLRIVGNNS